MSQYKVGNEFLPYQPSASHTPPEYRDGWNACYSVAKECFSELQAQLADAKQVANDCRIVADNAIAEALAAKKDAERYQWLRRTAVELSLSHQVISQFVTNQGELDAAIQAEGEQA